MEEDGGGRKGNEVKTRPRFKRAACWRDQNFRFLNGTFFCEFVGSRAGERINPALTFDLVILTPII